MIADFLTGIYALVIVLGVYFLPLVIAVNRKVPNVGSVAVINVFLGWTLVGWVIALAMALRSVPKKPELVPETPKTATAQAISPSGLMYRECPHCKEQMRRDASVCPHCQRDSDPWSKDGDRWWQLQDGERRYWDEQTQQWTKLPIART
jgi:hypothetical protein